MNWHGLEKLPPLPALPDKPLPQDRGILAYYPPEDLSARALVRALTELGYSAEHIELPPEFGISGWRPAFDVTATSRTKVNSWGAFHESIARAA